MNLQISPIGIILALPFYWLVFWWMRRVWQRIGSNPKYWYFPYLGLIVLPMPFVDELWIAWHFEQACKEAGVTVYRKVEVDGYVDATSKLPRYALKPGLLAHFDRKSIEDFDKTGYRFSEYLADGGGIWHVERKPDGMYGSVLDRPTARYHYRRAHEATWAPAGYRMGRNEKQVVDSQTGEILGRDVIYERFPAFLDGLWIGLLGSGQIICYGEPEKRGLLYHTVLIPKKPE